MLLAGKYFIGDWIQSPVLLSHWRTKEVTWLEWGFDEALDVEDVKMHIFVILCGDMWWYLVQTKVHILICTGWLWEFLFPCAQGIEQLFPHLPSRQQLSLPSLLYHRRSWTLSQRIGALTLKFFLSLSCF